MARPGREQQPDRTPVPNTQNNQDDNPGHAPESGEPTEVGFSHGKPIEKDATSANAASPSALNNPDSKDRESGRHQEATP